MIRPSALLSLLLLATSVAYGGVVPLTSSQTSQRVSGGIDKRSTTPLSASELSAFAPYTQLARAAYCAGANVKGWNCGAACSALPGFQATLVGGDGHSVLQFYVGYYPSDQTVYIVHAGEDVSATQTLLNDPNTFLTSPDSSLFPGIAPAVQAHSALLDEHSKTATTVLAEVQKLMSTHVTKKVITVGHSLGGAVAELQALYLSLHLPSGTSINAITYGTPRVGNGDFAKLLDTRLPNLKRINNAKDFIPIIPGRFLGYAHPQGEIHILHPGNAVACSGDDNSSDPDCTNQSVPNIFDGQSGDNSGPYEGIPLGPGSCT